MNGLTIPTSPSQIRSHPPRVLPPGPQQRFPADEPAGLIAPLRPEIPAVHDEPHFLQPQRLPRPGPAQGSPTPYLCPSPVVPSPTAPAPARRSFAPGPFPRSPQSRRSAPRTPPRTGPRPRKPPQTAAASAPGGAGVTRMPGPPPTDKIPRRSAPGRFPKGAPRLPSRPA